VVAFQSVFHSEKCANNIFLFFKNQGVASILITQLSINK
jgi:hypothetical protein